ncbi:MAG TPA: hypothetical protein VGP72_00930 [Planctomycetota bacterium]
MRKLMCLLYIAVLALPSAVKAEEPKKEPPKEQKVPEAKTDNLEVNVRGVLSEKAKEAPEGVVAMLTIIPKKFEVVEERKTLNLYAKGELVKQLQDWAKEKTRVIVTGTLVTGGISVAKADLYKKKAEQKTPEPIPGPGNKTDMPPRLPRGDENF